MAVRDEFHSEQKLSVALQRASYGKSPHQLEDAAFLHIEAANTLAERLAATKREFTNPALLFSGPFTPIVEETLLAHDLPVAGGFKHLPRLTPERPVLDAEPESLDLVISVFDLHKTNDLPGVFFQINMALKPDGLFLAVLPAAGTLTELAQAMLGAEMEIAGGAAARVDLFAEIRQLGDLLQKTGFKLPVCDLEERIIRYSEMMKLIRDLRSTGCTNTPVKTNPPLNRQILKKASELYSAQFSDSDGRIRASVNLAFLSGWKEDQSQQKPLKPGSAKHQLKDFL